jgi:hypothetical protein
MFAKALSLALGASSALAVAINGTTIGRTCGNVLTSAQVSAFEADFQAALARHPIQTSDFGIQACTPIPVYWHVIQAGTGEQPVLYSA